MYLDSSPEPYFIKKCVRVFPGGLGVRFGTFTGMAWVQSLVRELRSCKPCGMAKKKVILNFGDVQLLFSLPCKIICQKGSYWRRTGSIKEWSTGKMVTRGMVCRADLNLSFSGHWREHDSLVGAQWTLEKVSPLVHEEETNEPRACLRSQRACGRIWLAAQAAGIQAVTRGSTARLQAGFGAACGNTGHQISLGNWSLCLWASNLQTTSNLPCCPCHWKVSVKVFLVNLLPGYLEKSARGWDWAFEHGQVRDVAAEQRGWGLGTQGSEMPTNAHVAGNGDSHAPTPL